jgi:hypothetical protein
MLEWLLIFLRNILSNIDICETLFYRNTTKVRDIFYRLVKNIGTYEDIAANF